MTETTPVGLDLYSEGQRVRRAICEATVVAILEYADEIEAQGQVISGPDALREFAATIELALKLKEQAP